MIGTTPTIVDAARIDCLEEGLGMALGHSAEFRFYEELNDYLPPHRRRTSFKIAFKGRPSVKSMIEALGVPHPEIDLILVNGCSVGFDHPMEEGARVAVYPVFEAFDISPLVRLRPRPLRRTAFILDVHLGKLVRHLRLLGLNCHYDIDLDDSDIVRLSRQEDRIILTRDRRMLQVKAVRHGYWLRSTDPERQIGEVLARFDLGRQIRPFSRCLECNGRIRAVPKDVVAAQLPARTARDYHTFYRCGDCARVYWRGSHHAALTRRIERWRRTLPALQGIGGETNAME